MNYSDRLRLNERLSQAVTDKDAGRVRELLRSGADANLRDSSGIPLLHHAARLGQQEILLRLLDHGADIFSGIDHGGLDTGAVPSAPTFAPRAHSGVPGSVAPRFTALHHVVQQGPVRSAETLITWKLRTRPTVPLWEVPDEFGWRPLHQAAAVGRPEMVRVLLLQPCSASPDARDQTGNTPLHVAVRQLGQVAPPEASMRRESSRAKAEAAAAGLSGLRVNVSSGSDSDSDVGENPVQQYLTIFRLLLEYNAPIDAQNDYGETPLHLAAAHGLPEAIEFLLNAGASVTLLDDRRRTPKMRCSEFHVDALELLQDMEELNDPENPRPPSRSGSNPSPVVRTPGGRTVVLLRRSTPS